MNILLLTCLSICIASYQHHVGSNGVTLECIITVYIVTAILKFPRLKF